MLAASAAIGVVATFGTPVGGVIFSIEVTATFYLVSNLWRGFAGATTAVVCFQLLANFELVKTVPPMHYIPWVPPVWSYFAFISLGVLQGMLSTVIVYAMTGIVKRFRHFGLLRPVARRLMTLLSVVTIATISAFLLPLLDRGSYRLLGDLFHDEPLFKADQLWQRWSTCNESKADEHCAPFVMLIVFAVAQLLLMLLSIVMPVPSGCFMPLFVIGAATGRLYGSALRHIFGYAHAALPDNVMAIVGAASLAAGTTQTLSTALVTLEFLAAGNSNSGMLSVPVLLGVIFACSVHSLSSKSIYDQILVLKGLPYMPHLRTKKLYRMTASDIMRPTVALISAARSEQSRPEAGSAREECPSCKPPDAVLPTLNPYHPDNPKSTSHPPEQALAALRYDMSVAEALELCRHSRDKLMPLVQSAANPVLLGAVSRAQMIEWFVVECEIGQEIELEDNELHEIRVADEGNEHVKMLTQPADSHELGAASNTGANTLQADGQNDSSNLSGNAPHPFASLDAMLAYSSRTSMCAAELSTDSAHAPGLVSNTVSAATNVPDPHSNAPRRMQPSGSAAQSHGRRSSAPSLPETSDGNSTAAAKRMSKVSQSGMRTHMHAYIDIEPSWLFAPCPANVAGRLA